MRHYLEPIANVMENVKSSFDGLSNEEAADRLERDGKNKLKEAPKESLIKRFFNQIMDPMILILLGAAAISAILTIYNSRQGHPEFPSDVLIILVVVIINAVLGVCQESKAEAAIEALQKMSAATSKVLRGGSICHLKSEDIVVGDIILLEAGDAVPADARIVECASMTVEEAALTGESVPVSKLLEKLAPGEHGEITLGDRRNMVYTGSSIAYGRGRAVVTATGMDTEMGKIADAITQAEQGLTPLQIKLKQLSKVLTIGTLGICAVIFGYSVIANYITTGSFGGLEVVLEMFMIAVSLAVAAIPEGLVAVVTIVLSIGVTNMSRQKAIIRKLTAVETLGCTQIICSDKTGTLTQNKMTVVDRYASDETALATAMALCSDAELVENGAIGEQLASPTFIGEPTEVALVVYADSLGLAKKQLQERMPRVAEAPFDSSRKMMSTVHASAGGGFAQFTKGAPDEILARCTAIESAAGVQPLTDALRDEILAENKRMADKALRVLAAAKRVYTAMPEEISPEALEQDLILIGLAGMIDPVRPEVRDAIVQCSQAGIRAVMITGDHPDTARAIANELGILDDGRKAITGAQLSRLTDEEFENTVGDYAVYARVQPEHKVRIVNAWRKNGMVTAMTGDGVNDAPSIKSADIGVGMGVTGTDVTKNVADMVLADDNFATIVSAVGAGRRIYDNILRTIQFLLSTNLAEVIAVTVATIMKFVLFLPVHLLYINLVTDMLPAVALGMEHAEGNVMDRPPRKKSEGVFSNGMGIGILWQGVVIAALTLAAYFLENHWDGPEKAMTAAFFTLSLCEIFRAFSARSLTGNSFTLKKQNKLLWVTLAVSLVLCLAVIYVPFLAEAFSLKALGLQEILTSLGLAILIMPIVEIVKYCKRKIKGRK